MSTTALVHRVPETAAPGGVPLWRHPQWTERFPWLVQGTTGAGDPRAPFDLGLFGAVPVGEALARWRALRGELGMQAAVHARQVHGAALAVHAGTPAPGLLVGDGVDGHLTDRAGLLLTVSVADCVPLSLVDEQRRAVALLHAGWRGVAAGLLEAGVARMAAAFGSDAGSLWMHCGPAICGGCYEVGPEVHAAVRPHAPAPAAPALLDLRLVLVERAVACGLAPERISVSTLCTRCDATGRADARFFSHRAGSRGRQLGVLGIRG